MNMGFIVPGVLVLGAVLTVVSYVDRVYLQLSRVTGHHS